MKAPGRHVLRTLAWVTAVAASAAAGWVARGPGSPPHAGAGGARAPAAATVAASPWIVVAGDARAAPRIELPTSEGAAAQLAAQAPQRTAAALTSAAHGTDLEPTPATGCARAAADAEALVQAIAQGGDEARADALLRARVEGVPVPELLLRELIDSSPSDRVRLAAMQSWLELRAGDPHAERAALLSLEFVSNAAVQRDLRRRLVELDEMERVETLAAHGIAEPP